MSIWDEYPNYSTTKLRVLSASAAEILLQEGVEQGFTEPSLLRASPSSAVRQLQSLLGFKEADAPLIVQMLEDEDQANAIGLTILGEIRKYPDLANAVAERYELRSSEMGSPEALILAGALLLLVTKLKRIRIKGRNIDVEFHQINAAVKELISNFLSLRHDS